MEAKFSEVVTANLCSLHAFICMLGQDIEVVRGRVKIKEYGNSMQATNLQDDHWRTGHGQFKLTLYNLCQCSDIDTKLLGTMATIVG